MKKNETENDNHKLKLKSTETDLCTHGGAQPGKK